MAIVQCSLISAVELNIVQLG